MLKIVSFSIPQADCRYCGSWPKQIVYLGSVFLLVFVYKLRGTNIKSTECNYLNVNVHIHMYIDTLYIFLSKYISACNIKYSSTYLGILKDPVGNHCQEIRVYITATDQGHTLSIISLFKYTSLLYLFIILTLGELQSLESNILVSSSIKENWPFLLKFTIWMASPCSFTLLKACKIFYSYTESWTITVPLVTSLSAHQKL